VVGVRELRDENFHLNSTYLKDGLERIEEVELIGEASTIALKVIKNAEKI
jgi:hypothetical protein